MPAAPFFEIDVLAEAGDVRRVAVRGELDLATAPELRAVLDDTAPDAGELVLDLREVSFIDSSGLSTLVAVHAGSRDAGIGLVVLPSPSVLKLVELCDLQDVLPLRR